MKRRIISILAVLAMASLLLPTAVLAGAETAYPLWVAGIQVTESNLADVLGDGDGDAKTVAFDPQTNTLTLNGAHISETGAASGLSYVRGVKSELSALTVNLVGDNYVGKAVPADATWESYSIDLGFSCTGSIVFTGNADSSLTIYDYAAGIIAKNVTFRNTFKGKLTVRDSGGPEPQPPCAIRALGTFGDSYIGDGHVALLGGTFDISSYESNGISADGDVLIQNAVITVSASSDGIISEHGNVTVKDSAVTVTAGTGIHADNDVLIDNATLKVTADGAEGIDANNTVTVSNCPSVDISGADEAINASVKVSILSCPDVKLESDELNTVHGDDILVRDSSLSLKANNGYTGFSAVVYGDSAGTGSVTIENSPVTVLAEGNGIRCNSLCVSGGKTVLYCVGDTDSNGKGCGVYIVGDESDISVTGSTVKLTGGEAGIKFENCPGTGIDPFTGSLPVSFTGNTAYNTFTDMQEVNYKSNAVSTTFFEIAFVGDDIAKSLTVEHVHKFEKVSGVAPTAEKAGYKSYFACDCGKCYEDAECKIEIADLEKWKAEGGNGYLPKLSGPSPKTGDAENLMLWAVLLTVSAVGTLVCYGFSRKRSRVR